MLEPDTKEQSETRVEPAPNYLRVTTCSEGVRVQVFLAGQPSSWIIFETVEQAFGALDLLERKVFERFGQTRSV